MNPENITAQEEEFLALKAIYGDDAFEPASDSSAAYVFTLQLSEDKSSEFSDHAVHIQFKFPPTYPSKDPPFYFIKSVYIYGMKITNAMRKVIHDHFVEIFTPGEVVLFAWFEWLKEYIHGLLSNQADYLSESGDIPEETTTAEVIPEVADFNSTSFTSSIESSAHCPIITSGEPLVDRRSVFVAHCAPVKSIEEASTVIKELLNNKRIARATHNISAYRIVLENGTILQDNNDDGETAAGGRLMHLLQILDAKNVIVVVSRWYGGIQLGPDRFKNINNTARQILDQCGYIKPKEKKRR